MNSDRDEEGRSERRPIDRGHLEQTFGFLLRAAWREASRSFAEHFRAYQINPQQYATLILVRQNPGCATGDLGEPLGITPNNMVRLVDGLAERGLLQKSVHADDRRVRVLNLTSAGEAFLDQLIKAHGAYDAEFDARVGRENLEQLMAILRLFQR